MGDERGIQMAAECESGIVHPRTRFRKAPLLCSAIPRIISAMGFEKVQGSHKYIVLCKWLAFNEIKL